MGTHRSRPPAAKSRASSCHLLSPPLPALADAALAVWPGFIPRIGSVAQAAAGDHVREAFRDLVNAEPNLPRAGSTDIVRRRRRPARPESGAGWPPRAMKTEGRVSIFSVVGFPLHRKPCRSAADAVRTADPGDDTGGDRVWPGGGGRHHRRGGPRSLDGKFFRLAPRASFGSRNSPRRDLPVLGRKPFACRGRAYLGRSLSRRSGSCWKTRPLDPTFVDNYRPGQDTHRACMRRSQFRGGLPGLVVGGRYAPYPLAVIALGKPILPGGGSPIDKKGSDALHAGPRAISHAVRYGTTGRAVRRRRSPGPPECMRRPATAFANEVRIDEGLRDPGPYALRPRIAWRGASATRAGFLQRCTTT